MTEKRIPLVEVFHSPQGEGYNAGRDAIFVRTAGCPLSCVFADEAVCDTPYQKANLKPTLEVLFEEIIADMVEQWPLPAIAPSQATMLVLTGGEPTMQPLFDDLVEEGLRRDFYVAVETNGTRWREGLVMADWICVSPKEEVTQGSPAPLHNHNPQSPELDPKVVEFMGKRSASGEYRHVISDRDAPIPKYRHAFRHYLSPAVISDGSGLEWKNGFPGFVPGAVERCLEIIEEDPRWRISLQTHKLIGVR